MIIKNIVRFGIVAGIIMYSEQLGVWQTADETQEIYKRSTELAQPYADKAMQSSGFQMPPLPPDGQWAYMAVFSYNTLVKGTFNMLSMMPTYMREILNAVPGYVESAYIACVAMLARKPETQPQTLPCKPRYEDDFTYLQPGVDKKRKKKIPDAKCHCKDKMQSASNKKDTDEAFQKGYKERVAHEDYHYYQRAEQDDCKCDKRKTK